MELGHKAWDIASQRPGHLLEPGVPIAPPKGAALTKIKEGAQLSR